MPRRALQAHQPISGVVAAAEPKEHVRLCETCGAFLPITSFPENPSDGSRNFSECKRCRSANPRLYASRPDSDSDDVLVSSAAAEMARPASRKVR